MRLRTPTLLVLGGAALLAAAPPARANEVMKISDNRFLLTDQAATSLSGTGAMQRKVYRLSASLCKGLGYAWMLPLDSEASGGGMWSNSNAGASMEVEYFASEDEATARSEEVGAGRAPVECEPLADEKTTEKLLKKLRKRGEIPG
jgi:hypothetical protein